MCAAHSPLPSSPNITMSPCDDSAHLFPAAIVCSCGERFDSDWTTDSDNVASALWLYLSHKAGAVAASSSTIVKPHRVVCTLVSCIFCAQSVGVNHYRAHLAQCRRGDAERLAISTYRQLVTNRSGLPSFECALCIDDDRFHRLDVGTILEHRHYTHGSDAPPASMELYVTCRVCSIGVAVDNALEHAAFAHRKQLDAAAHVADMFLTAPQMRSLSRLIRSVDPNSDDDFRPIGRDEKPVYAPDCRESIDLLHKRLLPSIGHVRNAKREPSTESLVEHQSRATFEFSVSDYLAEEGFSEQLVDALCEIGAEPTSTPDRHRENPKVIASSASSQIVTSIRRQVTPPRPGVRELISTGARSGTIREALQECDECGRRFVTRQSLAIHRRQHTGQPLHECDNCGRRWSTAWNLERHGKTHMHTVESHNSRQRLFECDECGRTFWTRDGLRLHQVNHTCESPFACSDCGKRFAYRSQFMSHRRVHTRERPFACADCGKCFIENGHLTKHRRIHTGERSFACSDCGKRFTCSSGLTTHRRIHTGRRPYECSECRKRFTQSCSLRRHRLVHTGPSSIERPFACLDCGKRFTQSCSLTRHRRVHTGERPFVCLDCGKRFADNNNLAIHRRVHTGLP